MDARKETTKKEAEAKANKLKRREDLEKAILGEAMKLETGEQHSIQELLAYARKLKPLLPRVKDD